MATFAIGKDAAGGALIALGKPSEEVGSTVVFGKVVPSGPPPELLAHVFIPADSPYSFTQPAFPIPETISGLCMGFVAPAAGTYRVYGSIWLRAAYWSEVIWQLYYPRPGNPLGDFIATGGYPNPNPDGQTYTFDQTIVMAEGETFSGTFTTDRWDNGGGAGPWAVRIYGDITAETVPA